MFYSKGRNVGENAAGGKTKPGETGLPGVLLRWRDCGYFSGRTEPALLPTLTAKPPGSKVVGGGDSAKAFASILGALRGGSLAVFDVMRPVVLCVAVLAVGIVLSEENPDRFSMANDPCF